MYRRVMRYIANSKIPYSYLPKAFVKRCIGRKAISYEKYHSFLDYEIQNRLLLLSIICQRFRW